MSKFRNYALVGAFGLAVVASGMQITFNDGKDSPPTLKAIAIADEPERLVPEPGSEEAGTAIVEPTLAPTTTSVSDKEMEEIDDMIAATINLSGNLCARPIEVRDAGDGLYGVRCVTNRNGTGISDYILNSRTSEVIPI